MSNKHTAADLVAGLHELTREFPIAVANKRDFPSLYCDADFVAVTDSGVVIEYEVKVSRADFLRDRRKLRHAIYSGKKPGKRKASRFYYATTPGIVRDDLPDWAGLLIWEDGQFRKEVAAPCLRVGDQDLSMILRLAKAMRNRKEANHE